MSFMMATWRSLLAWRIPYLGGVVCILEEGIRPWGSLDYCVEVWSWLKDAWIAIMFM
jgi:hypothetical protein